MPRQLQLTQNLLDRAATAWNVVYSTVSFLINFPSHFEAFVKWIDSLDPSQALASSKIGAYLLNSAARQADGAWRAAKGRALQRKGHTNPVDEGPSDHWVEVHADSLKCADDLVVRGVVRVDQFVPLRGAPVDE